MTIIIKVTTRLETEPLVETEGHHIEVNLDRIMARILGRIIEGDHRAITEMDLEEIITEVKIIEIEVKVETDAETITEMIIDGTVILAGIEVE